MGYRNYIPAQKFWMQILDDKAANFFIPTKKFPISEIKIDKKLFDFQNEIDMNEVFQILLNFHREAWGPIILNKDNFLLDGQHRLEVARQMGLEYIDVIIFNEG